MAKRDIQKNCSSCYSCGYRRTGEAETATATAAGSGAAFPAKELRSAKVKKEKSR